VGRNGEKYTQVGWNRQDEKKMTKPCPDFGHPSGPIFSVMRYTHTKKKI
jgi:hypothetical protein